jgi:hypothetical protein
MKIPKNTKLYEIAIATVWVDERGIVCVLFKPVRHTIENNRELIELISGFVIDGTKICLVVDLSKTMPMRAEIRNYLAAEYPKYVKAIAVISDKPLQRTIATTFQTISAIGFPMNQFTDEVEAKAWLKLFLHKQLKVPNDTKLYETPIATFWLDKDGIVCATSKKVERTIAHYEKNFAVLAGFMKEGKKVLFLSDASEAMPMTTAIRDYFVNEIPKYVKAFALVSEVPLPGTLTTAVIKLSFEGFPVTQFPNETEAKDWLKTYL